ncbi:hypothetical protein BRO06_09865 [Xanthomonas oryzae pv. oryzae]|nr:hypothetical protein BRM19_01540 [Xanthomonas oryzae pv. oryzae]RBJ49859.1 hypothetical protein BRO06_09865 [Xanthomonas oryzae pv. oryzae]
MRAGNRESGIGNRESGIGNRESGIGNRESVACVSGEPGNRAASSTSPAGSMRHCLRATGACLGALALLAWAGASSGYWVSAPTPIRMPRPAALLGGVVAANFRTGRTPHGSATRRR